MTLHLAVEDCGQNPKMAENPLFLAAWKEANLKQAPVF